MDQRPNPDQLLKQVQADEESIGRGRLKLFFGASPGVGKTYAMLEAAKQRKKEGWDVAIGLVETHKRAETENLLGGLEILPRKEVSYKGVTLKEFDLDAALERRPRLIIVDELAHTNAQGLRHAKRWQDIEELLDAGIDVYTTLNVQHWESLNDVVAQIIGVVVHERVPDTFLKRVHELELVDLAPDDLLQRLKDGKVYQGELAGRAAESFFKPGNLIALRELALRHTAERVDAQRQAFNERHAIADTGAVGERLLVGVSPSPMSARLVRAASRLATRLRAPWIALHVETPAFLKLPAEERNRTINHMRLAEKLGAETVTLSGNDVTEELVGFAKSRNVTQIILGKPANPRWKEWLFGSILNDVARRCGDIDLHVIRGVGGDFSDRHGETKEKPSDWKKIARGVTVVMGAAVLAWVVDKFNGHFGLTFALMLGAGGLINTINGRLRAQTFTLRERAERMRMLYKLSRDLSETPNVGQMLLMGKKRLEEFYGVPVILLIPSVKGNLESATIDFVSFAWNENEESVAKWVFDREQMAGAGSDTLSGAKGLYVPMKGLRGIVGVLGIKPMDAKNFLEPEQLQLLETFASEIGAALESTKMSEEMGRRDAQIERQAIEEARPQHEVNLANLLTVDRILFVESESKDEIFRLLLSRLKLKNPKTALRAVLDREQAGSTQIGAAVAIPHARLEGLKSIEAAMAISVNGPIQIWVLFFSPTGDAKMHLTFLAGLAALFKNEQHVGVLASLASPQEVLKYLQNTQQK